jgi:GyrI-like small molecule binding domain
MSSRASRGPEAMSYQPRIVTRSAQPYLAVAREVTDGVAAAAEGAFAELVRWLGERGISPAGSPFIRVPEVDRAGLPFSLEAGLPVAPGVPGGNRVIAGELPAGRYATLLHVGPYCRNRGPGIDDARLALVLWTARHGLVYGRPTPRGEALVCCVDHLRVGPGVEPDHACWRTELAYLILPASGNGPGERRAAR